MRILLLTHRLPYPPNKGDKIRSFNVLKYLSARHTVSVASPIDDPRDLEFVSDVQQFAPRVLVARVDGRSKAKSAAVAIARGSSISVQHFYCNELGRQIDAMLDTESFDAFFCFSSPMAEYLLRSRHRKGQIARGTKIMDLIDVDSFKWRQYAQQNRVPMSWIYGYEARKLAAYEVRLSKFFDRMYLVSEQERRYLPAGASLEVCSAFSNGVDLEYFQPSSTTVATAPSIVFTGVMDYWPNVQGVRWFADAIFPKIRSAFPSARFVIVGSKPTTEVVELGEREGVTVTGFVEDVRDHLREASVCVVPLRIARGLQNKVLEAMAMGKAVVSTRDALEGIAAEIGTDVIAASDEASFAEKVIELLRNSARAAQIGASARACVERNYSWDANLRILDDSLPPMKAHP